MIKYTGQFKRGNFFTGLMATPKFWNDIQDYHYEKEKFYNLVFHGQGVVPGVMEELKVTSVKKGGNITIVVAPGFAIGESGMGLFLYEPQAKIIDYKKYKLPVNLYVVIKYNEDFDEYFQNKENPEYQGYQKKIENAVIELTTKVPDNTSSIELARIYLQEDENGEIKSINEPDDIANPKPNEIDTRFVIWLTYAKRGVSPYLKNYLVKILEDTKNTASIANDAVGLPGLRELQTVALTAKMLVQCGDVAYDDILNILYPLYDINNHVIQEMLNHEIREEKRIFSSKESFSVFRTKVHEMGDLIRYFDNKIETIDLVLKCQIEILDSIKKIIVFKKISFEDIALISYELPRIIVIGDDKYTLVEYIDLNDYDTEKKHEITHDNTKDFTTAKQSFTYPDGQEVRDVVKRYAHGTVSFRIRNLVKKRDLLLVRRSDIFHGNYSVDVDLNDEPIKKLVVDGHDSKNRWRNQCIVFEDYLIKDSSVKITFKMGVEGNDNFGKMWFYQKL